MYFIMVKYIFSSLIYFVVFILIISLFKRFDLFGFNNRSTLSIILEAAIASILFLVIMSFYVKKRGKKIEREN